MCVGLRSDLLLCFTLRHKKTRINDNPLVFSYLCPGELITTYQGLVVFYCGQSNASVSCLYVDSESCASCINKRASERASRAEPRQFSSRWARTARLGDSSYVRSARTRDPTHPRFVAAFTDAEGGLAEIRATTDKKIQSSRDRWSIKTLGGRSCWAHQCLLWPLHRRGSRSRGSSRGIS